MVTYLFGFAGILGFRPVLDGALKCSGRRKGGRPLFDPVLMFKILILQALNDLFAAFERQVMAPPMASLWTPA